MQAIPVLLAILVGLLFGLLAWGFLRMRNPKTGETLIEASTTCLFAQKWRSRQ